jgi:hypothetical protein
MGLKFNYSSGYTTSIQAQIEISTIYRSSERLGGLGSNDWNASTSRIVLNSRKKQNINVQHCISIYKVAYMQDILEMGLRRSIPCKIISCTRVAFSTWQTRVLQLFYLAIIYTGCPQKTKTIEINVLLEFECLSTLLNPHVHQSLT